MLMPRHNIIKMTRPKDKERIIKAAKEKEVVTYKRAPIRLSFNSQQKHFRPDGNGMKYSRS